MPVVSEPITIKGTRYGLLVSISEGCDFQEAIQGLKQKLELDGSFLHGAELTFDLGWRELTSTEFSDLESLLAEFNITIKGVLSTSLSTRTIVESKGYKAIIGRLGLAKHHGRLINKKPLPSTPESSGPEATSSPVDAVASAPSDEAQAPTSKLEYDTEDTLYIRRTLRSGQEVIYQGNVVIAGDINPGASVEAEGDVIVLGRLRGSVHAGCAGNLDATVTALTLAPTQLRIADHLWESPSGFGLKRKRNSSPGKAFLKGDKIIVEHL